MSAFWTGVVAGYGIAIPVGVIAILIVDTALRRGLLAGLFAGAGAAAADFLYAVIAAVAGDALTPLLLPVAIYLRWLSGIVLLAIGLHGLGKSLRRPMDTEPELTTRAHNDLSASATFARFLGLTLLNPLTVTYFGALIIGQTGSSPAGLVDRLAFATGAGIASLSWQSLLAVTGALGNRHFSPRLNRVTVVLGNGIVASFGARILYHLMVDSVV